MERLLIELQLRDELIELGFAEFVLGFFRAHRGPHLNLETVAAPAFADGAHR